MPNRCPIMKPTFMKVACDKIIPALIFLSGLALVGGCSTAESNSVSARPWNHPTKYEAEQGQSIRQYDNTYDPVKNYP